MRARGREATSMLEDSGGMLARHVESRKSAKQYPSFPSSSCTAPLFRVLFPAALPGMFLSQIARARESERSGLWIYLDKWRLDVAARRNPGMRIASL